MNEDPVNIDIVMRQNVDDEADKATRGINDMADASEELWKRSKEALQIQRSVIARLKNELEPLQTAFDKVNVGTTDPKVIAERERLSKAVRSVATELKGEEAALKEMMGTSDKVAQKSKTLETQMRAVREEMSALALSGKRETDEYRAKEQELGTLATAYREVYNTQTQLQKGGANLQGIISGISAITGIMSAGAGAFGLFNQESEDFQKIQTQVQSLMAITIGLQQVQNTLHSTSAFRIQTVTRAKQMWAVATTRLAVALGISNVAAKALMGTLTLGLSVAIGFVIGLVDRYITKQREAKEAQNKLNEAIAQNAASRIANYEKLRISYNKLGDDIKSKEKFIRDNQDAFKQLGVSINDVNDADSAFIANTEAFKTAIRERAIAAAAMDLASEQYKKMLLERQKEQEKIDKALAKSQARMEAAAQIKSEGMQSDATRVINPQFRVIPELEPLTEKEAAKEMDGYLSDAERKYGKAGDEWIQKNVDADLAAKKIFESLGLSESKKKKEVKSDKNLERAGDKLAKLSADIQKETDAAIVAAMQEGRDKKLAELKADFDARMALISRRTKEIEELEKTNGVDGSKQKTQLSNLADAEAEKYKAQVKAITDGSKQAIAGVMNEIDARFRTQNQNRIAEIDAFYSAQRQKAKENGATLTELALINLQHTKDVELEKQQIALETLDFEAMIAIKRAQIEDRHVLLQSQREEKLLRIQIAAAQKRLEILKEKGGDTEKDIAAVTVEIEAMNAELEKMPVRKFQELAGYAQQILDGIGSFASNFDEDLGGLFDMASKAVGGIAGLASGDPRKMVQGALQMLDVVGKVINANKRANEEIRKFNLSLAQQAIDYSLAVIRAIKDIKSETDSIFSSSYTNTLTQGMAGYNAALEEQSRLMRRLGDATVKVGVKKKRFLGIVYGHKDVYSNLLKQYPKLIKADGTLNRELAESLKKSGNLNEKTTQTIDNIISASDTAKEAMDAVENELQSLVGSIGNELKKALDDAFASGMDSAKMMTDNVVKLLKDISTQKMFNAVFGGLFSDLEKRMKQSYSEGGDKDLTDDIDWFMQNYPKLVDSYNKGISELQKKIQERYGVDAFAAEGGRTAVAKGIAQASQDSIDELNGRLTFLVMKVSDIGTINGTYIDIGREQLLVQRAMLGNLEVIAENSEFLKKLNGIADDIAKMQRDGIIIKR